MRNFFGGDPYYSQTSVALDFQQNIPYDKSPATKAITLNGVTVRGIGGKHSAEFASGNYVSLDAPTTVPDLGGGDWTLEALVYPTVDDATGGSTISSRRGVAETAGWMFVITGTNYNYAIGLRANIDGTWQEVPNLLTATNVPFANRWSHVAITRRNGVFYIFRDGRLVGVNSSYTGPMGTDASGTYYVGSNTYATSEWPLTGAIAYYRHTLYARYLTDFTPPAFLPTHGVASLLSRHVPIALPEVKRPPVMAVRTKDSIQNSRVISGEVLVLPLKRDFLDKSKDARTVTNQLGGMTIVGESGFFDGDAVLYTTYSSYPFSWWERDTCYELELKTTSLSNFNGWIPALLGNGNGSDQVQWTFGVTDSGAARMYYWTGTERFHDTPTGWIKPNTWHHLAFQFYGSTLTIFVDGKPGFSGSLYSGISANVNHPLRFGNTYNNETLNNVYVKNIKITVGVKYVGGFNVSRDTGGECSNPTEVVPSYAPSGVKRCPLMPRYEPFWGDKYFNNVVLAMPLISHLRDQSKTAKATTIEGNTTLLNGAAYFDGSGDCIHFSTTYADFSMGSLDFTLEAWINPLSVTSVDRGIIDLRYSFSAGYGTFFIDSTVGGKLAFWDGSTKYGATGTVISLSTWQHVACVRYNGKILFFLNGKLDASGTMTTSFTSPTSCGIGGSGCPTSIASSPFYGYIKQVNILKGIARYVSNFNPPSFLPVTGVAPPNGVEA